MSKPIVISPEAASEVNQKIRFNCAFKTARKVLNSIKAKLNLDKFPRGTFIEVFGDDLAYIRYNGCIEARFSSGELTDEEAEEWAQKIIDTCGAPELITSEIDDMERGFLSRCADGHL